MVCGGSDYYARDDCVAMDLETGEWSTVGRMVGHRAVLCVLSLNFLFL